MWRKVPAKGHFRRLILTSKRAVCLLSGGLDSTTALAYALKENDETIALSFRYGQRHSRELEASERVARHYGVRRRVLDIDLGQIGGSSLTDDMPVETRSIDEIVDGIPTSYVPARNTIFIALASAYLEKVHGSTLYIGVNAMDYSGYPDCRPEFISSIEDTVNLGTGDGKGKWMHIKAPLQYLTKSEIIRTGLQMGVPYELTTSCYKGGEKACGECDSCLLRLNGFKEAGSVDPAEYEKYPEFYANYLKKIG